MAQATENDTADISPIRTTVIDFDQCRISSHQLSKNDELFEKIDGEKVINIVTDDSKDPHLRLLMAFYLPLNQWNEDVFDFIKNCDLPSKKSLFEFIILRSGKDIHSEEVFMQFFDLLQTDDLENQAAISLCLNAPQFVDSESDFYPVAQYVQTGRLPSTDDLISEEQIVLLLLAIDKQFSQTNNRLLSNNYNELKFIMNQLTSEENIQDLAIRILNKMISTNDVNIFENLLEDVVDGDLNASDVAILTIQNIFDNNQDKFRWIQYDIFYELKKQNDVNLIIYLLDLQNLPQNEAERLYNNMYNFIEQSSLFDDNPEQQTEWLNSLANHASQIFNS